MRNRFRPLLIFLAALAAILVPSCLVAGCGALAFGVGSGSKNTAVVTVEGSQEILPLLRELEALARDAESIWGAQWGPDDFRTEMLGLVAGHLKEAADDFENGREYEMEIRSAYWLLQEAARRLQPKSPALTMTLLSLGRQLFDLIDQLAGAPPAPIPPEPERTDPVDFSGISWISGTGTMRDGSGRILHPRPAEWDARNSAGGFVSPGGALTRPVPLPE